MTHKLKDYVTYLQRFGAESDTLEDRCNDVRCDLHENKRLLGLYETRLRMLIERNTDLELVAQGCEDEYERYENYFRSKIDSFQQQIQIQTQIIQIYDGVSEKDGRAL